MHLQPLAPRALRRTVLAAAGLALAAVALIPGTASADRAERAGSPPPSTGWHGRAVREPHRSVLPRDASRWPAGWTPRVLTIGAGYARRDGSPPVRATQRMLRQLGYRPGPVDGRFGPRTAGATAWFQYKHGLRRTGVVGPRTLALLRARANGAPDQILTVDGDTGRGDGHGSGRRTSNGHGPRSSQPAGTTPTRDTGQRAAEPVAARDGNDLTPLFLALLLLLPVTGMAAVLGRRSRRRKPARQAVAPPVRRAPERRQLAAVGYVALPKSDTPNGVPADVLAALEGVCAHRGWALTKIIHDVEPASGRINDRPGLFHAMELLSARRARVLVVPRLRDLTGSVSDLGPMIRWMEDAKAGLVVLDVRLDTTTEPGRTTARTLEEVSGWERRRIGERTRLGLAAARSTGKAATRPSVRDDPELVAWIERMRADGMSLQAIADALNERGVPTRRGGTKWRPSSVQSALGYKRPASSQGAGRLPPVREREGP